MSQLDSLLARSRSPGTFVTRKRFTLARHKAIEKMREFALRHPKQYVLELVQAAVFAEATWIAIDVKKDSLLAGWVGGKMLTEEELGNLFDYLFIDQADLPRRHLMQLAVGLNAIYQRKPKVVRIESGDGTIEGTTRMELGADGAIRVGQPEEGLGGTYLYAEFQSDWWPRFFTFDSSIAQEARLVEERCGYTPVPILLNGSAPFGYRAHRDIQLFGVRASEALVDEQRRGTLGLMRQGVSPELRLVVGGVWVSSATVEALGAGVGGVVADNRLRKTADMSDIVRDERWVRMLHAVQPVATRLLRAENRNYTPPKLPPKPQIREVESGPTQAAAPAVVAVPIEDRIRCLGPRPPLDVEQVCQLPEGSPVFWVLEEAADALEQAGDPASFPFHVLLLDEGRAAWLAEEAPRIALSVLTTPADFRFVHRILARRSELRQAGFEVALAGGSALMNLRLHVEGRLPDWGVGGGLPALIQVRGQTRGVMRLPLDLHGISAVIDLDVEVDPVEVAAEIVRHALAHAWKLVDPRATDNGTRRLTRTLLSLHARPTFVERDGKRVLDAILPADWGPMRRTLRGMTLADTAEGPLSLDALIALIQEGRTASIPDPEAFDELAPLELVFGPGHLHCPARRVFPLLAVGRWGDRWVPLTSLSATRPEVAIGVGDQLAPSEMEGWALLETLGPVEVWVRPGVEAGDVTDGLVALSERLQAALAGRQGGGSGPIDTPRGRVMARLALLCMTSRTGLATIVPDTTGEAVELVRQPLRFLPLHGPRAVERGTVAVSFDELRAIEAAHGPQVLRLDDGAEVWHGLAEGAPGWLIRQEVRVPGVEGWIGLRSPYDASGGILLETSRAMVAIGAVDRDIPCHGILWAHSTAGDLKPSQVELVRLAAVQLYQRLLEIFDTDLTGADRAAADQYAAAFALRTAALRRRLPSGTARELAARVQVRDDGGAVWGSLERWLDAEPRLRPALPDRWAAHLDVGDTGLETVGDARQMPARLAARLREAIAAIAGDVSVRAHLVPFHEPGHLRVLASHSLGAGDDRRGSQLQVEVHLNADSPSVKLAHTEWRLFEMLLLEAARQVAVWREDSLTYPDLARTLVAQRMSR